MECRGRRSRRGRGHSCTNNCCNPPLSCTSPQYSKPWSFLSSIYSFFILTSLLAVVYLMLDYHCSTCNSKCDLNQINKSIEDIAKNLLIMKNNYHDLETKISRFSQDLPKIEGQIEILEALATAIDVKEPGWNPRSHMALPNVDVFLTKSSCDPSPPKNMSKCKCPTHTSKPTPLNPERLDDKHKI